jgi:hypothetical protein
MWETTFPLHSHAGLGRDFTEIQSYSDVCSVRKMAYPIRRGYGAEMLFPTWNKRGNADFEGSTFQGREYSIWAMIH